MPNEFSPELQSILEEEGITEQPAKAAETPTETSVEAPEIVTLAFLKQSYCELFGVLVFYLPKC